MKLTAETTVFNEDAVQSKFSELVVDADGIRTEVSKKVGTNEVISRINQSAESVQIQASKIEIDGVINAINNDTTTTINGGKITTGTLLASAVKADSGQFNSALIPNLSADKITSGKISADRINVSEINIGAAQITSGTIDSARIPNLSADKITTGTLQDFQGNTSFDLSTGKLDITKGTINIGNGNFIVDASGHVYIKGGCIDVANGDFTVSQFGTVQAADIQVGNNNFHVNEAGNMWAENARFGDVMGISETYIEMHPNKTTSAIPNLYLDSDFFLRKSSWGGSSKTVKKNIEAVKKSELDPAKLYDVDIVQFEYIDGILSEDDPRFGCNLIGFIIEDLDKKYPIAVDKNGNDPKDWTWNNAYLIPPMLKLIQDQKAQIDELKFRMREIEEEINGQGTIN